MANIRAVDFIDGWTKKSGEIRDNGLRMMVTRTLEAIKSMNGTSVENIEFHRGMLKSDRETAQKFDTKIALDHDLQFFYAIGESIELTMETVIERIKHPAQNPTISQSVLDQKLQRIPTKQQVPVAKQMPRISHSPRIPAVPQMPNVPLVPQASPVPQIPLLPQTISPVLTAAPVLGFHGRKPGRPRKSVNPEQPAAASIPSQRQAPNPILQNLIRNARNRAAADQFAVKQEIMDDTMPVLDAHIAQVNRVIKNEVDYAAFPDSNAPSTSRVTRASLNSPKQIGAAKVDTRRMSSLRTQSTHGRSRSKDPVAMSSPRSLRKQVGSSKAGSSVSTSDPKDGGGPMRRDSGRHHRDSDSEKSLNCSLCKEKEMAFKDFIAHLTETHQTTPCKAKIAIQCTCGFVGTNSQVIKFHKYSCRRCMFSVIDKVT